MDIFDVAAYHHLNVNRFWDDKREVGVRFEDQAMDFVLVRRDGWTIGGYAAGYDTAYALWPDQWIGKLDLVTLGDKVCITKTRF